MHFIPISESEACSWSLCKHLCTSSARSRRELHVHRTKRWGCDPASPRRRQGPWNTVSAWKQRANVSSHDSTTSIKQYVIRLLHATSKSHSSGDRYSRWRFNAVQFTTLHGSYCSSSIRSGIFTRSTSAHAKLLGHNWTWENSEQREKTKILSPSCQAGPCDSISYQLQKHNLKPRSWNKWKQRDRFWGQEQSVNVFSIAGILVWEDTTS